MTSLADKGTLSGADNRLPMLEKDMYDSWKSRWNFKENRVTRPKKYSELSATKAIQADCDVKATNNILQGLSPEVYALLRNSSNPRQQATINNGRVTIQPIQGRKNSLIAGMSRQYTSGPTGTLGKQRVIVCYNCKGEGHKLKQCTKPKRKKDETWFKDKVHNQDNVTNNEIDQDVQAISTSEQSNILNHFPAQQDDLILSVIEQLKTQAVNCTKSNQDYKNINEILTAELERYKDQVRILKEQNNVDKASASCA
nr:hypothetical protein [Tanacetum cinerariifolium]